MLTCNYRSAPQVANLGGHPVQPPFKIPESIIYYVHLNVTKFDRHFFVWENVIFVMWLNSLYYCSDVSITVSIITMFFEVFTLFKFVNKIRCTENYLELHETNDIYGNPINQGLIWNLFWCICHREKFCVTCTWTLQGQSFGIVLQNIFGLYITLWKLSF